MKNFLYNLAAAACILTGLGALYFSAIVLLLGILLVAGAGSAAVGVMTLTRGCAFVLGSIALMVIGGWLVK